MRPNGTGKSTLAKVMAVTDYTVESGDILLDGKSSGQEPDENSHAGFSFLSIWVEIPGVSIAKLHPCCASSALGGGDQIKQIGT